MRVVVFMIGLCASGGFATAEEPANCLVTQDMALMADCAGPALEKADKALNAVVDALMAQAIADDVAEGKGRHDTERALQDSQRAWLVFREAECKWQGFAARGDSLEPVLVRMCAAKLAKDRVKQLQTGVSE